jgi:hypothetical protein
MSGGTRQSVRRTRHVLVASSVARDRNFGEQGCAASDRTGDLESAAECLDAIRRSSFRSAEPDMGRPLLHRFWMRGLFWPRSVAACADAIPGTGPVTAVDHMISTCRPKRSAMRPPTTSA